MLQDERDQIPHLALATLISRAEHDEGRAQAEATYASMARGKAEKGEVFNGPESWEQIAEAHERMAKCARERAVIYRAAIAEREQALVGKSASV